ncbi:MAG: methyltransferase [Taibaiella sp.]|nr:methyltransferase [Taibaiella sp.]
MKVTTDACIQGAWTTIEAKTVSILDIGAGTGLLSLMLAQRHPNAQIDAVEYDHEAARQAGENFEASPWKDRLHVVNTDIKDFHPQHQYDLIICNPPFFVNSLLSGSKSKDRARHDISLTQNELAEAVARLLSPEGRFSVLLPYVEYRLWQQHATTAGLIETGCLYVKHTPITEVKRVVGIFQKGKSDLVSTPETLVIKDSDGNYSPQFCELLSGFYLAL